jgi:hypothetical protein
MVTLEEAGEAWDITINGKGGDCPLTVYTYNGEAIDYSEEQITVEDAFDTSFDYEQVMGEYGPEGP